MFARRNGSARVNQSARFLRARAVGLDLSALPRAADMMPERDRGGVVVVGGMHEVRPPATGRAFDPMDRGLTCSAESVVGDHAAPPIWRGSSNVPLAVMNRKIRSHA